MHSTPSTNLALGISPDSFGGPADALGGVGVAVVVLAALALGIAAQTFINSMLKGDQGLGAFLSDGGGYSKSGFKPRSKSSSSGDDAPLGSGDPLPWLKLPKLDFVDVAGQENTNEAAIVSRLEELTDLMKVEVKAGNTEEANRIRNQLESLMEEYGFQYETDLGSQ